MMKRRIATVMVALVTIAFLVGCAGMPGMLKVKVPAIKEAPLAKILVYVGEVPLGESGRSADGTEINIGGMVYLLHRVVPLKATL